MLSIVSSKVIEHASNVGKGGRRLLRILSRVIESESGIIPLKVDQMLLKVHRRLANVNDFIESRRKHCTLSKVNRM